jgi:hypothetical protein
MIDENWFNDIFISILEKEKPLEDYSDAEIDAEIDDLYTRCVPEFGQILFRKIKENASKTLAENRKKEAEFSEHIWKEWGPAFDSFQIFLELCVEVGNEFAKETRLNITKDENDLFMALIGLQARGCEIGFEVFTLLKNGFPDGAHARWRTLYEITVIAAFLKENGNEAARRYLLHEICESNLEDYQKYCTILGYAPFSEDEIAAMKKKQHDLEVSFGGGFEKNYGWATDILRKKNQKPALNANFREIERAANFEHMHSYHQMASHNIHAGSKALKFRLGTPIKLRGPQVRFGPSIVGFTDPAHGTSIALGQLTVFLLTLKPDIYRLTILNVLELLTEEIGKTFFEIDNRLQEEAFNESHPEQKRL